MIFLHDNAIELVSRPSRSRISIGTRLEITTIATARQSIPENCVVLLGIKACRYRRRSTANVDTYALLGQVTLQR